MKKPQNVGVIWVMGNLGIYIASGYILDPNNLPKRGRNVKKQEKPIFLSGNFL